MRNKILKTINLILIVSILALACIVAKDIPSILISKTQITKIEEVLLAEDATEGTFFSSEVVGVISSKDAKNEDDEDLAGEISGFTDASGLEFYCHWHGHPPGHTSYKNAITKEQIKNTYIGKTTKWKKDKVPEISIPIINKRYKIKLDFTDNYYFPVSSQTVQHDQEVSWTGRQEENGGKTETISLANKRGYAIEYVLTYTGKNKNGSNFGWNDKDRSLGKGRLQGSLKQQVVWKTKGLTKNYKADLKNKDYEKLAKTLQNEADAYATYYKKFKKNDYKIGKSAPNDGRSRVHYDFDRDECIIGPFKVDYVSDYSYKRSKNQTITFAGMTGISLISLQQDPSNDDPQAKIEVKTPITTIIQGNERFTVDYFNPINSEFEPNSQYQSYVDETGQKVPNKNEDFYVVISGSEIKDFKRLDIEFAGMEAKTELTFYRGFHLNPTLKSEVQSEQHNYGTTKKPDWHTRYRRVCTGIASYGKELDVNSQYLFKSKGLRTFKTDTLSIDIPDIPYNLEGTVWEDRALDGIRIESEPRVAGVEVYLRYALTGEIVAKDLSGATLRNPTVTDENGHYIFQNLSYKEKYYVEFRYNGQTFEATKFTGLVFDGVHSNAKELQTQRQKLNEVFAETNPQGIYRVWNKAPAGVDFDYLIGDYNYIWLLDKTSSESQFGIKEIYDSLIKKAVAKQNYADACKELLNEYMSDPNIASKLQFIEDCRISAYIGDPNDPNGIAIFPKYQQIVVDNVDSTVVDTLFHAINGDNLSFGIVNRLDPDYTDPNAKFDLALIKDVDKVTTEINGVAQVYNYGKRKALFDVKERLENGYYDVKYSRELFLSDYTYKASMYENGGDKSKELEVYVTYKLTVKNQSSKLVGEIKEIVDYYDEDFKYIPERSYLIYAGKAYNGIEYRDTSIYGEFGESDIDEGYNKLYVTDLQNRKLGPGETAEVYLTFKVNKFNANGEDWVKLDINLNDNSDIGVGKENIAEINGAVSYYKSGTVIPNVGTINNDNTPAGVLDKDSIPGNLLNTINIKKDGSIEFKQFEDDSDKAPNLKLILYTNDDGKVPTVRRLDGFVFEDMRTESKAEQKAAAVGNGLYEEDKDKLINGVRVQLVEKLSDGINEKIWTEFKSGQGQYVPTINLALDSEGNPLYVINNQMPDGAREVFVDTVTDNGRGKYIFTNYQPGNYVIRFIYGDNNETILTNTDTAVTAVLGKGQNDTSYNGQDYKSTTYQAGIAIDDNERFGQTEFGRFNYYIDEADANRFVSDAKDSWTRRTEVISKSDKNVKNALAELIAEAERLPQGATDEEIKTKAQANINELKKYAMIANTGVIGVKVERAGDPLSHQDINKTSHEIHDVLLGLEERPRAQLKINKAVSNVRLVLADGSTLFDISQKATNALWSDHKEHEVKYDNLNKLSGDPMIAVREAHQTDVRYGLIQLSVDSELMLGSRIQISYKITVTNVGEVDYNEKPFYYTGKVADVNTVVKSRANQLVDYVGNNLQFAKNNNDAWQVIEKDQVTSNGLVNKVYQTEINKYNTIITTTDASKIINTDLVPTKYKEKVNKDAVAQATDDLILTQLITPESDTDDLTYTNVVEIVVTSNDVGRRNAYSIVGNQNPNADPNTAPIAEIDADRAQTLQVLPPFGNAGRSYVVAAIIGAVAVIFIIGIVFIQKKVIKRKNNFEE